MDKIIQWRGRRYKMTPEHREGGCTGCAMRDMDGPRLCSAPKQRELGIPICSEENYIFVDASTDEGPDEAVKLSNPKDLVGIRKAPMSTVSAAVMAEVGVAMHEGALKYGRHNYRAVGVRSSVYYDGTMRHLMAWWEGEDVDPDSELSHITKAITSLVVLRDAMLQGKCTDDRPPRSAPFYAELNARAAALIDKHADKNPRHYTIDDVV
jgi:hypothetical protein